MTSDYHHWLSWYRKTYPNSTITDDEAEKAYDEHYFCKCESCEYRKEKGQIPVTGLNPKCQLPQGRGDLNYVKL